MDQSPGARARGWASDAAITLAESATDVLHERLTRPKYDDAARIALDVVAKHIRAIDEAVESGSKVPQQDHYLNKRLRDIRSEMEEALGDRWADRGSK